MFFSPTLNGERLSIDDDAVDTNSELRRTDDGEYVVVVVPPTEVVDVIMMFDENWEEVFDESRKVLPPNVGVVVTFDVLTFCRLEETLLWWTESTFLKLNFSVSVSVSSGEEGSSSEATESGKMLTV
jgi:hypothetical protein